MAEAQERTSNATPDIRHYQNLAASAALTGPSPATVFTAYERKRLEHEGWSDMSIADFEMFGRPVALLYSLISKDGSNQGAVMTSLGQGTLISARDHGCRVLLTRSRKKQRLGSGTGSPSTENFVVADIKPVSKTPREGYRAKDADQPGS